MSEYFPYAGTSGWSGTDTSRERALRQDADGTTERLSIRAEAIIGAIGARGVTWRELAEAMDIHHGQASGSLSRLHKIGHLCRLTERRDRCKVYVRPDHVNGRPTEPFAPRVKETDHDRIVAWLTDVEKSPDANLVTREWATYFRTRIETFEYLNNTPGGEQ